MTNHALWFCFAFGFVAACTPSKSKPEVEKNRPPSSPAKERPSKPAGSEGPSDSWTRVSEDELSATQKQQVQTARAAIGAMAGQLMGRLQEAMKEGGPTQGIEVCKSDAPRIAASVAQAHGVKMGRTSFKLRNPNNAGPDWTQPYVSEQVTQNTTLAGPDGRLGFMSPIQTGEACLKCHGEPSALAPGVAQALKTAYPKDQAIGFEEGDLRGWFWVEVPVLSQD